MKSPITTHVLDTAKGRPAVGIAVSLEHLETTDWKTIATGSTDADGRISDLLPEDYLLRKGTYRLSFRTGDYQEGFYPFVSIAFEVSSPEQHYHVPLLLSPFGYSTYRGS